MMKKLSFTAVFGCLLMITIANAQKVGQFSQQLSFNSEMRNISFFVPKDYDSTKQYGLMVCLHGSGDNANNFGNYVFNSLKWQEIFDSTIIMCLDGGSDQSADFYAPAGDEAFIQKAITYATDSYAIDTNQILLHGFSLGGRSALKYGLDHQDQFAGLYLNTPAIQGVLDLNNDPRLGFGIPYESAAKIPVYITVGKKDYSYLGIVQKLEEILIDKNAMVHVDYVPNLGHGLPSNAVTKAAKAFLSKPTPNDVDAEAVAFVPVLDYCQSPFTSKMVVRNVGAKPVNKLSIDYEVNGTKINYQWTGSLKSFEHVVVQLPQSPSIDGYNNLKAKIIAVNDGNDNNTDNDTTSGNALVFSKSKTLPLTESFESNIIEWNSPFTGNIFKLYLDESVASDGNVSLSSLNSILAFATPGFEEFTQSPPLDLTSINEPSMAFNVAFNYMKYTPPYFTQEVIFTDTLVVSISTDCGESYTELYRESGEDLATTSTPITNPLQIQDCIYTPGDGNWSRKVIDLADYGTETAAMIKISVISGMGGSLYLDDINFNSTLYGVEKVASSNGLELYPNPASDRVMLSTAGHDYFVVSKVYDMSGRMLHQQKAIGTNPSQMELNVEHLEAGTYLLITKMQSGATLESKLFIAH